MALFAGQTTTWEDVQIKMGNFAERDPEGPSMEEQYCETMDRAEGIVKQDFVDDLLRNNHCSEDSDLLALRQARIEQLKRLDSQATVRRITKESYMDEVTEGSKLAVSVVMMDRGGGSSFLEFECRALAKEWATDIAPSKGLESTNVRFYVGDVDDLVGTQFPPESLPFAVIYAEGSCQSQMPRASTAGIRNGLLRIVRAAKEAKATPEVREDESDGEKEIRRELAVRRATRNHSSDEDDESDDETARQRSKGYSSTYFERNVLRYR